MVNNVEGKILVLWGLGRRRQRQNGCVTSLRHHTDVRSLTNNIKDWHYFIPQFLSLNKTLKDKSDLRSFLRKYHIESDIFSFQFTGY